MGIQWVQMIILQNHLDRDRAVWLGNDFTLKTSSVSYRQHLYVKNWAARFLHQNPEHQRTQNVEFIIIFVILVYPTFLLRLIKLLLRWGKIVTWVGLLNEIRSAQHVVPAQISADQISWGFWENLSWQAGCQMCTSKHKKVGKLSEYCWRVCIQMEDMQR